MGWPRYCVESVDGMLTAVSTTARRRTREPDPSRFRMGQGRELDTLDRASEESGCPGVDEEEGQEG